MNKNIQKFVFVAALALLIVPQVTFAAWWNPLSWGIFSSIFHSDSKIEVVDTTKSDQVVASTSITVQVETLASTSPIEKPVTKPSSKVSKPKTDLPVSVQIPQQPKPTGTFCNGTYWNSCPSGQNLICPTSGDAYCQAPQQPVQAVAPKDNYQICRDSYGHATWDGSSYTSDGGPNCSCEAGYGPSSDGNSCVVVTQAAPQIPQQDLSISNSACQTATQNLKDFQTGYANGYGGLSTSGTSNVAAGRSAIFTNQYNTELPAYQMAARAACQVPASNSKCQASLQEFDAFQKQYPISQLVSLGARGDAFALRFSPYQTDILYACQ